MKLFLTNIKNKQGFTLIETFVAILILIFAVIGPLGLLSRAISDGNYAKNQITAHFLAQETAEYVIYQRNQNVLAGSSVDWLGGLNACVGQTCKIDVDGAIGPCDIDNDGCLLYIDNTGGFKKYTHTASSESSIFQRQVEIERIGDDESARVLVTVKWINKTTPSTFELPIILYNPNYTPPAI